jgi:hypothetical protein
MRLVDQNQVLGRKPVILCRVCGLQHQQAGCAPAGAQQESGNSLASATQYIGRACQTSSVMRIVNSDREALDQLQFLWYPVGLPRTPDRCKSKHKQTYENSSSSTRDTSSKTMPFLINAYSSQYGGMRACWLECKRGPIWRQAVCPLPLLSQNDLIPHKPACVAA